jgi:hypothetical protein
VQVGPLSELDGIGGENIQLKSTIAGKVQNNEIVKSDLQS